MLEYGLVGGSEKSIYNAGSPSAPFYESFPSSLWVAVFEIHLDMVASSFCSRCCRLELLFPAMTCESVDHRLERY